MMIDRFGHTGGREVLDQLHLGDMVHPVPPEHIQRPRQHRPVDVDVAAHETLVIERVHERSKGCVIVDEDLVRCLVVRARFDLGVVTHQEPVRREQLEDQTESSEVLILDCAAGTSSLSPTSSTS